MRDRAIAGQWIMEPGVPQRPSSGHIPAVIRGERGSGLVCYGRETPPLTRPRSFRDDLFSTADYCAGAQITWLWVHGLSRAVASA